MFAAPGLANLDHLSNRGDFYREAILTLQTAGIGFLVGGGYAMRHYTGIIRHTKDLDIFVRAEDVGRVLGTLEAAGMRTELTFPHWLGKAYSDDGHFVDVVFSSGNGLAVVDDGWFQHAVMGQALGRTLPLCPPEEMVWSKSYVAERERYDGADVAHLFRARGLTLDWRRLLERFGPTWRVLLSHLILYGFIYPGERDAIPSWVIDELMCRVHDEGAQPLENTRTCHGTLLSREQYLADVERWGYRDGRLDQHVRMTEEDIALWTSAIAGRGGDVAQADVGARSRR